MQHAVANFVEHRSADNDAVEVPGETLRLDHALTPAGGAAFEIGIVRPLAVIGFDQHFGGDSGDMGGAVAKIDFRRHIVVGPRGDEGLARMAHVLIDHSVIAHQGVLAAFHIDNAAHAAATLHEKLFVPGLHRQAQLKLDGRRNGAAQPAVLGQITCRFDDRGFRNGGNGIGNAGEILKAHGGARVLPV